MISKKITAAVLSIAVTLSALFCCYLTVSADNTAENDTVIINGVEYVETFFDDFNGTKLDTSKWSLCPEWDRQGASHWNNDMTSLDGNGNLLLKADYISGSDLLQCGAIRTKGKFNQARGYFEIRCKLQSTDGFWSAFWMFPESGCQTPDNSGNPYKIPGGTDGTEIDIFEQVNANAPAHNGKSRVFQHALHWDGYGSAHRSTSKSKSKDARSIDINDGEYHTFALDWSKDKYDFYVDGKLSNTIKASEIIGEGSEDFDTETSKVASYLKISLESSTGWSGKPTDEDLPGVFTVDYVRAYQRVEYLDEQQTTTSAPTTAAPTTEPTTAAPVVYGDCNSDEKVNLLDLIALRKRLAKWNIVIDETAADCNADSEVDLLDLILLRKYLAKWNVTLG
ncbi:MAG: family 16 glycosylhydrolase [Acutalibacteraceae bacterium]